MKPRWKRIAAAAMVAAAVFNIGTAMAGTVCGAISPRQMDVTVWIPAPA